jgi:hypothetical protein
MKTPRGPLSGGHRAALGNRRRENGQALRRARPLWRRAASTARPARVRMRSRKPWVFALRRLFGWNVRLLTGSSSCVEILTSRHAALRKACGTRHRGDRPMYGKRPRRWRQTGVKLSGPGSPFSSPDKIVGGNPMPSVCRRDILEDRRSPSTLRYDRLGCGQPRQTARTARQQHRSGRVGFVGGKGNGAKRECYVHNLWTDLWNIGKAHARGASGE